VSAFRVKLGDFRHILKTEILFSIVLFPLSFNDSLLLLSEVHVKLCTRTTFCPLSSSSDLATTLFRFKVGDFRHILKTELFAAAQSIGPVFGITCLRFAC